MCRALHVCMVHVQFGSCMWVALTSPARRQSCSGRSETRHGAATRHDFTDEALSALWTKLDRQHPVFNAGCLLVRAPSLSFSSRAHRSALSCSTPETVEKHDDCSSDISSSLTIACTAVTVLGCCGVSTRSSPTVAGKGCDRCGLG